MLPFPFNSNLLIGKFTMAKVSTKSSKKVKKVKPSAGVTKSRTRPGLTERNAKRVKVESGVKSLPKAKHIVRVMSRQVREIYGYVAEETSSTVVFKTRAFLGASRKAQYLHFWRGFSCLISFHQCAL